MLPLYYNKLGAFWEIIISRATSGGRREIELNYGSLPPIPGGLATLHAGNIVSDIVIGQQIKYQNIQKEII